MQATGIVEALDVSEQIPPRLVTGGVDTVMDTLGFEGVEEALLRGLAPAIALIFPRKSGRDFAALRSDSPRVRFPPIADLRNVRFRAARSGEPFMPKSGLSAWPLWGVSGLWPLGLGRSAKRQERTPSHVPKCDTAHESLRCGFGAVAPSRQHCNVIK